MEETVKLIECYRNTHQGEGVDSGKRVALFRFKYCNKKCYFCDTLVKMRISQEAEYKLRDLQKILDEEKTLPMITGGEPTFDKHFNDTLKLLNKLSYPLANLETNGYNLLELIKEIDKSKKVNISYSPKIFNGTDLENEMNRTKKLIKYPNVYFKVVYENREDVLYYLDWLSKLNVNQRVYLMIEGITRADLIKNSGAVFDACEEYKFNFSSRDHIIYGFI